MYPTGVCVMEEGPQEPSCSYSVVCQPPSCFCWNIGLANDFSLPIKAFLRRALGSVNEGDRRTPPSCDEPLHSHMWIYTLPLGVRLILFPETGSYLSSRGVRQRLLTLWSSRRFTFIDAFLSAQCSPRISLPWSSFLGNVAVVPVCLGSSSLATIKFTLALTRLLMIPRCSFCLPSMRKLDYKPRVLDISIVHCQSLVLFDLPTDLPFH